MEKVLDVAKVRRGRVSVKFASANYIVPLSEAPEKGTQADPVYFSVLQQNCAKSDVQLFLGHSERSTGQLRKKVLSLGYPEPVALGVVRWAEEYGLVDDIRFCKLFVSSRTMGKAGLQLELRRRGVPEEAIHKVLASISEKQSVEDLVMQVSSKYGHIPNRETARRRAYGWLSRRGFSSETIHTVLKEVL